jgi:hypothetical protein
MADSRAAPTIPPIRRARGFRIYDLQGRRYLDLFRDGALLGHRGAGSVTVMKSALSQGLAASLPSTWEKRLAAALVRAFPRYPEVRLYSSHERAVDAVCRSLGGSVPRPAHDPALDGAPAGSAPVLLWRPLLPFDPGGAESASGGARALLPILPLRVCGAPAPACFAETVPSTVPCSDTVPGFILAAALRSFTAILSPSEGQKDFLSNPSVEKALDAAPGWSRTGPYVKALFPESEYPRVHAAFLDAGVLLSPGYPGPSVLPGDCSPGESRLLADLFTGIPGG